LDDAIELYLALSPDVMVPKSNFKISVAVEYIDDTADENKVY